MPKPITEYYRARKIYTDRLVYSPEFDKIVSMDEMEQEKKMPKDCIGLWNKLKYRDHEGRYTIDYFESKEERDKYKAALNKEGLRVFI